MNAVQYEERRGQRDEATRDICLRQKDKRLIGKIARKGRRRVPVAVGARVFVQRGKKSAEKIPWRVSWPGKEAIGLGKVSCKG